MPETNSSQEPDRFWLKLAAVIAGFALLPIGWFGSTRLSTTGGNAQWLMVSLLVVPVAGYRLLLFGLPRWRSADRGDRLLIVSMSAIFWLVYVPIMLVWILVDALGLAGGI